MISTELLGNLLKTPRTLMPPPPPSTVTAGCTATSGEISELFEIYMQMGKNFEIFIYDAIV
jgi:hypothetical protein